MEKLSYSAKDTRSFALDLALKAESGMVIALIGNLGTGKTTFSQGFAQGLGINRRVGSPTFKLVSEYTGDNLNFYHVDCYRLNNSSDFIDIGGENLLYPVNAVTLIEWAEKIEEILPSGTIRINFYRVDSHPNQRKLKISGIKA